MRKRVLVFFMLTAFASFWAWSNLAFAIPILQTYVEGGTYDSDTETWVIDILPGDPIRLWTIGNVDGPGGAGTISDVRLAVAYPDPAGGTVVIDLTPSTTGDYGGFADDSTPSTPTWLQTVTDGSVPKLTGGSDLPSHGIYGDGTHWQEFLLGNFSLTDSPMADFINSFPIPDHPDDGQINVYEVVVSGLEVGDWVHFDLYDSVASGNKTKAKFAPFSHDGGANVVPEPATMLLLGTGLIGLAGLGRKKLFK